MCSYTACTTHYRGGTPHAARRGGERGATRKGRVPQRSPEQLAQRRPGKGVGWRRLRCGPRLCFRRRGPPGALEPGARPNRGGDGGCARALAVYKPPPPKKSSFPFADQKTSSLDVEEPDGDAGRCQAPRCRASRSTSPSPFVCLSRLLPPWSYQTDSLVRNAQTLLSKGIMGFAELTAHHSTTASNSLHQKTTHSERTFNWIRRWS
jgi:hypothetical protein